MIGDGGRKSRSALVIDLWRCGAAARVELALVRPSGEQITTAASLRLSAKLGESHHSGVLRCQSLV